MRAGVGSWWRSSTAKPPWPGLVRAAQAKLFGQVQEVLVAEGWPSAGDADGGSKSTAGIYASEYAIKMSTDDRSSVIAGI
jgi:hypothetical protein